MTLYSDSKDFCQKKEDIKTRPREAMTFTACVCAGLVLNTTSVCV